MARTPRQHDERHHRELVIALESAAAFLEMRPYKGKDAKIRREAAEDAANRIKSMAVRYHRSYLTRQ